MTPASDVLGPRNLALEASSRHQSAPANVRTWYVLVALVTLAALAYGVVEQIYDTNFYVLWEATALLAGDNPYRDFYQMGWPLLTAVSTAMQWLVGYRLIGEFVLHWMFIVAAMVIGFHLALHLSRSLAASLSATAIGIVILLSTPTFQFPKLFFYTLAVWIMWRYMNRPNVWRAAAVGTVTAVAFLYRHDHGLYIAAISGLAFVFTRVAVARSRAWRLAAAEGAAYLVAAVVVIIPWAIVVQANDGVLDYVQMQAAWGNTWAISRSPFRALLQINPLQLLSGEPGRPLSRDASIQWLLQVTLLLPLLLLVSTGIDWLRSRNRNHAISLEARQIVVASSLALLVGHRLFRESGYFVAVLPLTVAFGARLLASGVSTATRGAAPGLTLPWAGRAALAVIVLSLTGLAAVGSLDWDLLDAGELDEVRPTYRRLIVSPPIDGYESAEDARRIDRAMWSNLDADKRFAVLIRYLHDCTVPGDRLFVTGSTPYQVGYYTQRGIAGGHVQWHHGWRSDREHELQSLGLLERQSVPFAIATHDPVLADLEAYPNIRNYFMRYYTEIEGSNGLLLVDSRRRPSGTFGQLGLPCFR